MAGKENRETGIFRTVKQEPAFLSSETRKMLMQQAIENLQKIERDNVGRENVVIGVRHNNPIEVRCVSDLHIGALATDFRSIDELATYVMTHENVAVVLLGDEIEGIKKEYLDTNRTPLDLESQIDYLRTSFLIPLAEQGKILAMVSGYWGHPGWAQDSTTINIWNTMTTGLNIPILQNGGKLEIRFANGHTQSIRIRHNPPSGNNIDPVAGLRQAELSLSEGMRTDVSMSGHIHRSAVGKEKYFGAEKPIVLISSGTEKGSKEDMPRDRYGEKLGGANLCDPMGQGMIMAPRTRQREKTIYPFASEKHGRVGFAAINLLDRAEAQGMTKELKEIIAEEVEAAPKISYYSNSSRISGGLLESQPAPQEKVGGKTIENKYSGMKMKAPYDSLTYDIQTRLPVAINFIQNTKIGSSSEGLEELKPYLNLISKDPHSLVVYLRNMIDKEAGKSPDRIDILENFVKLIGGSREQTLAIMMDESMRMSSWKKAVGMEPDQMPVAPASYMATQTGIPLIHHLSLIKLAVGPSVKIKEKPLYIGAFADKLLNSGSFSQPTFGLKQIYSKFLHEKPGYVVGGHMPSAGTMTFFDRSNPETHNPILVAPGWWAKYVDSMGKGNVMPGAEGGQAIIFMPGNSMADYLAFPTVDASETKYMQDALTLLKGLEILGMTDQVLGKKGR